MTLVYILSGILLLGALSYVGIRREKNERLRFEREELARLEEANGADDPAPAVGDPEPLSVWDPSPVSAGTSVYLGSNGTDPLLWQPLSLPNPHLLIVGGSGSGKSQTLKAIAHELREACAVVILDLHGDLDLEGAATHELHFRSRYGINPLVLSLDQKGGGPNAQREIVRTRLHRTFAPMGSLQLGLLDRLLRQCYEVRGIRHEDPTSWYREPPSFADLEALFQREIAAAKRPEKLEALRTKISPVFDCQIFSRPALPIREKGITRIDMSRLSSEVQFLAGDILLRHLFREAMLAGEAPPGKLRTLLVIDEAKFLALRGKGDPLGILNRLATEARKYGLGLLLASQDLEHFTRDILTNVAAKLVLMHAETAIRTTAGRLLLEKEQLQALREPFVGLVKLGGGRGCG